MIAAGFGFRAAATADSLRDALTRAGGAEGVAALATVEGKAAALAQLARELGLQIVAVPPEALRAHDTPTRSPASLAARHVGSVAEAAALAAAGRAARLLGPRVISGDRLATCALAEGGG